MDDFESDSRFPQATREAILSVGLSLVYMGWWYLWAYGVDSRNMGHILGLPAWFFMSCIVGGAGFVAASWGAVCLFFRDMPLDGWSDEN